MTNQTKKMNYYQDSNIEKQESRTANSRFAKAGVSYFYDSEVLNSSFCGVLTVLCSETRPNAKPYSLAAITSCIVLKNGAFMN